MNEDAAPTAESAVPPITEALRAEARAHPGGWVYAIDPGFDGAAGVPPQAVVGAWRSDARGELSGSFVPNPRYVATPRARGWSLPGSELEDTLQLTTSGYASEEQLHRAFASAEVVIYSRPEGGIFLAPAQDHGELVYAFTTSAKASASGWSHLVTIGGATLASSLPVGVRIALDPGSTPSGILDPERVARP